MRAELRAISAVRVLGWGVLGVLLAALFAGALTLDRSAWPSSVGDEATYAMQAESLAWDLDLGYSRADFDRYLEHWGAPPEGLVLQSRDGGRRLVYSKPFYYALAVAPFARLAPRRGALLANVLFLALAAVLAARSLAGRIGDAAPLAVAAFLFASVAFAYAFWIHADLFLLSATAAGYALAYRGRRPRPGALPEVYDGGLGEPSTGRFVARWLAAGALLGIPVAFRPFYLPLLLPPALAVPPARRRLGLAALLAGALAVVALGGAVQWSAGGSWSPYGGERQGFYQRTGYPEVDFPATAFSGSVMRWGNASWIHEESLDFLLDARLWGWNALYFLAGENVGVGPYFLPLALALLAFRAGRGRAAIPLAAALVAAGFLLAMPFNFYGGQGAIANRYFLPVYPALWFLAARPLRAAWVAPVALAAALFLFPLWREPRAYLIAPGGTYRHAGEVARRALPYETTQSHIPGGRDVTHNGLWIKFLSPAVGPGPGGGSLVLQGSEPGEVLVGSPVPLTELGVNFFDPVPGELEVTGAELAGRLFRPDGSAAYTVVLASPRARHPMWWTRDDYYLYALELRLPQAPPEPVRFELVGR